MKHKLALGLATLGLVLVAQARYSVGDVPADFTCNDWNGGSWNLESFRGKVVVLNFGATW